MVFRNDAVEEDGCFIALASRPCTHHAQAKHHEPVTTAMGLTQVHSAASFHGKPTRAIHRHQGTHHPPRPLAEHNVNAGSEMNIRVTSTRYDALRCRGVLLSMIRVGGLGGICWLIR